MSALGFCLKGVSHSCRLDVGPAVVSCVHVRIFPPDTCRTQRASRHRDPISGRRGGAPLELDGWSRGLGSSHGDCERLPRLPSTATGHGRLHCKGPGIEVQLSVSKERLQRHLMDDICSTRNAHALSMNHAQICQMQISEQLSMASLEHVLLPR